MAKINLLPWRAELRKERKQQFFTACGIAGVAALGIVGVVHLVYQDWIGNQQARNKFLQDEIAVLDKKIVEIKDLEKERQRLVDRMHAIEELQTSRPVIVHLFDELVKKLPDGVFLTEVEQKSAKLTIRGVAESNARVSSFMRNIEGSSWMREPRLDIIETKAQDGARVSNFTLRVDQSSQTAAVADKGETK